MSSAHTAGLRGYLGRGGTLALCKIGYIILHSLLYDLSYQTGL